MLLILLYIISMHVVTEKQLQIHPSTVTVQQPIDCKFYLCMYNAIIINIKIYNYCIAKCYTVI